MKKMVGLLFAVAFVAIMLLAPIVSAGVSSVEWTYDKDIKGLTTLDFTSSFVVEGGTSNDITVVINNVGAAAITVTGVNVHKVTPRQRGNIPRYSAGVTPVGTLSIYISSNGGTGSIAITCWGDTGANLHLWVYFTISGQTGTYHIGVNIHFR